jgi:hypothetical protein
MLWGVMWTGRVVIIRLSDDLSGQRSYTFRAPVSGKLNSALIGELPASNPCPRQTPGPQAILSGTVARDPDLRREYGFNISDT